MVLRMLKRLLGLDSSSSSKRGAGRDVTVRDDRNDERPDDDRSRGGENGDDTEPAADDADAADTDDATESEEADEAIATDTDADSSTDALVDEESASEEPTTAAEPAEAAGPESEDVSSDIEEAEPEGGGADSETDAQAEDDATDATDTTGADDGRPVDEVKGIGPAYSERLAEIGINSAEGLADADPEDLAERIDVPEKTIRKWIDRASEK